MGKFTATVVLAITLTAIVLVPTTSAAKSPSYSPGLGVSWPFAAASTNSFMDVQFLVSGCGYDASYGGVTLVEYSPTGATFTGASPGADGCISSSAFSAYGPGSYRVDAWQHVGKKAVVVASTSFTLG